MMQITDKTTVGEALPYIRAEHFEKLLEKCDPMPLVSPIIGMTVGEFIECLNEDYYKTFFNDYDELIVVAIGRIKQFNKEVEEITKVLQLNDITESNEEKAAKKGIIWPTFQESMLCNCVDWFHLHSLDEAEKIPLSNYLIYNRKVRAESKYERQLNQIYANKNKPKKK